MDDVEASFMDQGRFDIPTAAAWCRRHPSHRRRIAALAATMAADHAAQHGAPVRLLAAQRYARDVLRRVRPPAGA